MGEQLAYQRGTSKLFFVMDGLYGSKPFPSSCFFWLFCVLCVLWHAFSFVGFVALSWSFFLFYGLQIFSFSLSFFPYAPRSFGGRFSSPLFFSFLSSVFSPFCCYPLHHSPYFQMASQLDPRALLVPLPGQDVFGLMR
ncbi:MAG: hypothetical protein K0R76_802 [Alphaproteobacteria bacterium]|nr:hypothetical protein [Alphaproteobacteria bacterium]